MIERPVKHATLGAVVFSILLLSVLLMLFWPGLRAPFIAPFDYLCDSIDQQKKVDLRELEKEVSEADRKRTLAHLKGAYNE